MACIALYQFKFCSPAATGGQQAKSRNYYINSNSVVQPQQVQAHLYAGLDYINSNSVVQPQPIWPIIGLSLDYINSNSVVQPQHVIQGCYLL